MRGRTRLLRGALCGAMALAVPAVAHAELPLDLTWDAPPQCPSEAAVRAELERVVRVGRGRTPPRLVANARIEQQDGRWHLQLRTQRDGVTGERRLEAGSCASLVGAATLVVGLAFGEGVEISTDTLGLEPRPAPVRPSTENFSPVEAPAPPPPDVAGPTPAVLPPPQPPAPPEPAEPIARQTAEPSEPSPPWLWSLSVDGRSAWGVLARQSFGFGVGLDVGARRWFASLRSITLPPAEETLIADARVRFAAYGGSLSGCLRGVVFGPVTAAGCLGLQLVAARGQSVGAVADYVQVAPLYAAVPALRIEAPVYGSLSVQLGLEVATALHRPKFEIEDVGVVFRVPRLAPTLTLGLAARL